MAKPETRRKACSSEVYHVSSAYVRLSNPRESATSEAMIKSLQAGGPPSIFIERQPALIVCNTYHLRGDRQNVRHLDLVNDFSSDLEDLSAHWLQRGSVKPILKKGGQCQLD